MVASLPSALSALSVPVVRLSLGLICLYHRGHLVGVVVAVMVAVAVDGSVACTWVRVSAEIGEMVP
jgi:hypothetical protein